MIHLGYRAGLLRAVGDGPVPRPPLAQEGLAALGDLGRLVHVFVVLEMSARRGFDSSVN